MNYNYSFSTFSKLQKFELYLLPPLIAFFIFSTDVFVEKPLDSIVQLPKKNQKQHNEIEIISWYENLAKEQNITIKNFKIEKNQTIFLKCNGNFENLLNFVQHIEQKTPINFLKLIKSENELFIEGNFSLQTFSNTIDKPLQKLNIKNRFLIDNHPIQKITQPTILQTKPKDLSKQKEIIHETPKEIVVVSPPITDEKSIEQEASESIDMVEILPKAKTVAIVGEYVLLNKQWLKVGDDYKGYLITAISNKSIQFTKNGHQAIMELFDED